MAAARRSAKLLCVGLFALALTCGSAAAMITEIRLEPPEPFADGASLGAAGSYLRVKGTAIGELDPSDPANSVIVDLDRAPRNARGNVEYRTDVFILKPADAAKSSGVLVYDVLNRGRKFFLTWMNEAAETTPATPNDPKSLPDAGNRFMLDRGATLVWSGWDPDVPAGLMRIEVPTATNEGRPIAQRIRDEFQIATRGGGDGALHVLPYPAVSTDKSKARLTVREKEGEPRTEIPADKWEFLDQKTIRLMPAGTKFFPVKIHELWYEATAPKVVGMGFAATRDLVSYLRNGPAPSPATIEPAAGAKRLAKAGLKTASARGSPTSPAGPITHTIAFGVSQSGRYLRHFLELGMNADEQGRRVFDGMLSHIAGAGKVSANHTFAMPGRTATQHEDRFYPENWFPFSRARMTDPFTSQTGRLHSVSSATEPRMMEVNTSTEYWQKGASLVHMDPTGRIDARLPENERVYMIAGTQHGGRAGVNDAPGLCAMPRNPNSAAPALRALLRALEAWVVAGDAPPASRVPSLSDRTAVEAGKLAFPKMPGFVMGPGANRIGPPADWIAPPREPILAYATLVSAIDGDGNETAGIRLPPVAVPLATFTGWNVYKAYHTELCDRDGASIPFARNKAQRDSKGDARLSREERYGSRDAYVAKVKDATAQLVQQRLLLPADAAEYVLAAEKIQF